MRGQNGTQQSRKMYHLRKKAAGERRIYFWLTAKEYAKLARYANCWSVPVGVAAEQLMKGMLKDDDSTRNGIRNREVESIY